MDSALPEPTLKASSTILQSTHEPTAIAPLKEFVYLQRLPVELQDKTWKLAVPQTILARVVSIIPKVKGNQLPSGLLHLCSASRSAYRKYYQRVESKSSKFAFFINYDLDTLDINQYNSGARPFRRFNPPLPVLTSVLNLSFSQLKLEKVRKLALMVESKPFGPYPRPSYETQLSGKFQMQDGESFWLMIEKVFPNLKSIIFILNKVKAADLRQLVRLEVPESHYRGPTLRNALLDLMEDVVDGFMSRTSNDTEKENDNYWLEMGLDCMVFEEKLEKHSYLGGQSIPDSKSWV